MSWTDAGIAARLKAWGIDPEKAAQMEPEPLGEQICVCGEMTGDGPCQGWWRLTDDTGPIWAVECDVCGFETGIPPRDPKVRHGQAIEKAGLPERFVGVVFDEDDNNRDVLQAIRMWLADYGKGAPLPAPALYGLAGRGKTHLLTAVCARLIHEHNASVLFRPVRELLRGLQRFDDEYERNALWNRAVSVDVFALDDLGAHQITDWRRDQIAHLIDERYQRERPVILATNYKPDAWDQIVDARTASRLAGMTFGLQLMGPDRRLPERGE